MFSSGWGTSLANHRLTFLRCFQSHHNTMSTHRWAHLKRSMPFVLGKVQRKQRSPNKARESDLRSWGISTEERTLQGYKLTSASTEYCYNLGHWVCQHFLSQSTVIYHLKHTSQTWTMNSPEESMENFSNMRKPLSITVENSLSKNWKNLLS